jgi:hypothetical protein
VQFADVFGHASAAAEQLQVPVVAVLRLEEVEFVAELDEASRSPSEISSDAAMRSHIVSI